mgnify:CR=1 FL=1
MRCHLREGIYGTSDFSPSSSKFRRPRGSARFPSGFRQKNFRTVKFSAGKNAPNARVTDGKIDSEGENCDRRSACATRKKEKNCPGALFMSGYGMKRGSGCGEGSPAPSALHVRVVLPISTSAVLLLFRQPTILSLPCNPPQNQHRRINCMKTRARFLFPIPYPFLPQHHVLPFSFHILEYFSKHTEDRKAAWNLNSHRTDNR